MEKVENYDLGSNAYYQQMATKLSVVDHLLLDEEVKKRGRREGEEEAAGDSRSEPLPPSAVNYQMRSVGLPGENPLRCRYSVSEFNDWASCPVLVSRTSCTAADDNVKAGGANLSRVKLR